MRFRVKVIGREVPTAARMLEALTRSGLLSPDVTWEEGADKIVLTISGPEEIQLKRQKVFREKYQLEGAGS